MITIIHGDDTASSRIYYRGLLKNDTHIFDGEKVTLTDIQQATASDSLFSDEKNISLENFFSKRKSSKEAGEILNILQKQNVHTTILFWENKSLTKKQLETFPNSTQKSFTLPKSLFAFLDAYKPNNTKQLCKLYHETLAYTEAEMILAMLVRQTRILLALTDPTSHEQIDEINRVAPWQKSKLSQQAKAFSLDQLKKLHTALFHLDVKSKSGGLSLPLAQMIDFLLISI